MKQKVLIIAYYFPPMGGGGVQRTTKFVKYLPELGWEPVVLTVREKIYRKTNRILDVTLFKDIPNDVRVIRTDCIDLTNTSKTVKADIESGSPKLSIKSLINKIGGLVINPDSQMPWIPFAVTEGIKLIKKHKIDVIYSTANPWSDHIIGAILKKITGLPWVADYRDAWNLNPYLVHASRIRKNIQLFLETKVIEYAHQVIFATEEMKKDYIRVFGDCKFETIRNGFDPDDFKSVRPKKFSKFTILYSGNIWSFTRPSFFILAISNWLKRYPQARREIIVKFLGRIDVATKSLIDKERLEDVMHLEGHSTHAESIALLLGASVLLLTIDEGGESILTGKIFEYLAAGKPILALVPPSGMAADLLKNEGREEYIVSPKDVASIEDKIMSLYTKYKNRCLPIYPVDNLQAYTRRKATEKLSKLLNSLKR